MKWPQEYIKRLAKRRYPLFFLHLMTHSIIEFISALCFANHHLQVTRQLSWFTFKRIIFLPILYFYLISVRTALNICKKIILYKCLNSSFWRKIFCTWINPLCTRSSFIFIYKILSIVVLKWITTILWIWRTLIQTIKQY